MTSEPTRPVSDRHGDTPIEIGRLQAENTGVRGPEHRTQEALRMSSALLRQRQATLREEFHGER
ncbi:MAG: hypothetical protein ACO38P_09955, partial [Phycisphaerales bacterium]